MLRFIKFAIVGIVGFFVNYATIKFLQNVAGIESIVVESILATLAAISITFFLHDKWTYKPLEDEIVTTSSLSKRFYAFMASNTIGAVVTITITSLLVSLPKFDRLPALIIAALMGMVWNYTINKVFIWKVSQKKVAKLYRRSSIGR